MIAGCDGQDVCKVLPYSHVVIEWGLVSGKSNKIECIFLIEN